MTEGAGLSEYPQGMENKAQENARFIRCLETAIEENLANLSESEKVKIRFPAVKAVGAKVALPNRGTCEIVRYELTKRFGLKVTYKRADETMFTFEHFD
jgi:hypothetical protein